jgi:hypothetical protein
LYMFFVWRVGELGDFGFVILVCVPSSFVASWHASLLVRNFGSL